MDLAMLALGNARVRDEDGWRALFQQADEKFRFDRAEQPKGSHLALVEVTWNP